MNLEIGMYVRTINGKIWIITSQQAISGHKKDIINASYNIIDLIEENDLIEIEYELATGQKQQEILEVIKNREEKLFVNSWIRKMFIEEFKYFDIEIKSILTKEQFKSMEYKVKE